MSFIGQSALCTSYDLHKYPYMVPVQRPVPEIMCSPSQVPIVLQYIEGHTTANKPVR